MLPSSDYPANSSCRLLQASHNISSSPNHACSPPSTTSRQLYKVIQPFKIFDNDAKRILATSVSPLVHSDQFDRHQGSMRNTSRKRTILRIYGRRRTQHCPPYTASMNTAGRRRTTLRLVPMPNHSCQVMFTRLSMDESVLICFTYGELPSKGALLL